MTDTIIPDAWQLEADMAIGTDTWRNSIHLHSVTSVGDTAPSTDSAIVTAWKNFMLAIHYNDVDLASLTLRPAIQRVGPTPGVENPPIWVLPVNTACTGNTTYGGAHNSNYLPQDVCVYAKKTTTGGRSGKNFFRNILTEVDVQSTLGGGWTFSPGAGHFDPAVFNAAAVSLLGPFFNIVPTPDEYYFIVAHLMTLKVGDTRPPRFTVVSAMLAERPVWNNAQR